MNHDVQRIDEKGNVLFLILIAVALFAALSYAVTQSTRSGGGSADRETSVLNAASMTQYPASLRTSLIRMILNGTDVRSIEFNAPSDFGSLANTGVGVFHPAGGGAVYQQAAADIMDGPAQGTWRFNAEFFISDIGIDDSITGNDVIAFLPDVALGICESVNAEFSIDTTGCTLESGTAVPRLLGASATADRITEDMINGYVFQTPIQLEGDGGSCNAFAGQPSGCFRDQQNGRYVFYSVLLER